VRWFRTIRIALLLLILVIVAASTWQDRYHSTRWREPLFVALYPIAADDSPVTRAYVDSLDDARFEGIDRFFAREAGRYGLAVDLPFKIRRQAKLERLPPEHPPQASMLRTALWSLQLRYWAWKVTRHAREPADVRVFVLYHDPAITPTVPHSLGLAKGLIGVVYAFAAPIMNDENEVVIAHELLHTVGATDKYDPTNDAPRFPEGYGNPEQVPLYPQADAELMAGRRMLTQTRWDQVTTLDDVVIGASTAAEIRWPAHPR
jgi:hypothetical protein